MSSVKIHPNPAIDFDAQLAEAFLKCRGVVGRDPRWIFWGQRRSRRAVTLRAGAIRECVTNRSRRGNARPVGTKDSRQFSYGDMARARV